MTDLLVIVLIIVGWILINRFVLPRFGVPT